MAAGLTKSVSLLQAAGEALPFADKSFDVVSEFADLHHVPNPSAVVREMLRVARKSIVIVDSNRFGQGSMPAKLLKLTLYKLGPWSAFNFMRTRGKNYQVSEGDGLFYSYSVYDSFSLLTRWADRLLVHTNSTACGGWTYLLLTTPGLAIIAIRDGEHRS